MRTPRSSATSSSLRRMTPSSTPADFDGTRSLDPDEDELTYVWDFGDGDGGIGARVSHQYLNVGTFRVILTVSDDTHSASDTTVAEALSLNKPPVAVAGGPYNGAVGQPVQFDGLGSHDPEGDSLSFHWSFGDGFTEDGPTPTHTYAFANVFNVLLEVRDATGAGRDSTTATISSATANLFASQGHAPDPVVAGGTLTYSIAVGNRGAFAAADAGMSFSAFGSRISITSVTTNRGSCASDSDGCC